MLSAKKSSAKALSDRSRVKAPRVRIRKRGQRIYRMSTIK